MLNITVNLILDDAKNELWYGIVSVSKDDSRAEFRVAADAHAIHIDGGEAIEWPVDNVGLAFAIVYGLILVSVGRGGWLWGAALGVLHSLFLGTVGVNVLLPAVHPRMGGDDTTFESSPLMEAPGSLMLNYGRSTPLVSLVAHVAYGAIIGGLVSYPLAAAGAILVGMLESFSSFYASAFKEVIVFTLIIPVLLWRSLRSHHLEEEEDE